MEEFLTEEMIIFFKVESESEILPELEKRLTKESQYDYYDYIYKNYIRENSQIRYHSQIIPGYNIVIKLAIFAVFYRSKLYPSKNLVNSPDCIEYLYRTYIELEDNISILDFKVLMFNFTRMMSDRSEIRNLDIEIETEEDGTEEVTYNFLRCPFSDHEERTGSPIITTKSFCYYIFIGNRLQMFDEIAEGYFGDTEIVKFITTMNLYKSKTGPHENTYLNPYSFFDHDFDHFRLVSDVFTGTTNIQVIQLLENLYMLTKRKGKNTFLHRFYCLILWYIFNETGSSLVDTTVKCYVDSYIEDKKFIDNDSKYGIKWILRSHDIEVRFNITKDTSNEEIFIVVSELKKFFLEEVLRLKENNPDIFLGTQSYEEYEEEKLHKLSEQINMEMLYRNDFHMELYRLQRELEESERLYKLEREGGYRGYHNP